MDHRTTKDLVAALQRREVSAVELLERTIADIEKHDTRVNAVVVRDFERARRAAMEADRALARGDHRPLLGVPITVKEAYNVAGLPTTWGIEGTEHQRAEHDAVAVARLKAAGAVLVGKTNVPVMLYDWQTYNDIYGVTRNPWDLDRTPGGSSGGSAAALAAGFVSLEMGSDLAGSLRVPAHCCGVYAHMPTHGLVPMRGFAPPGVPMLSVGVDVDLAVVGPMARSAADLMLAMDVVAGPDDAQATAYRLELPPPRHATLAAFRVLVLDRHPTLPTSQVVRDAIERFAGQLARAGCRVARASPLLPDLAQVTSLWGALLAAFSGADMPADEYKRKQAEAAALPADSNDPAAISTRGNVMSHRDWIHTDRARMGIAHQWRCFFREWDVIVCPVLPTVALPHDHGPMDARKIVIDGQTVPYTEQGAWMALATLTGLPATAMPIARSADGLPIGVQVIGPYLEDLTPLRFAELVERERGGFVAPPGF